MKIQPECVSCLMNRVLFQARLADNGSEFEALSSALRTFSDEFKEGKNSADIATEVHRAAYGAMGVKDPYLGLKIRADEVASEYMDIARELVEVSENRIRCAVRIAAIGNIMDFGSGSAIDDPDEFRDEFFKLFDQGIEFDDTEKIETILKKIDKVIYIFDNCGESQLDRILIEEIKRIGIKVIGVVRGEPILNDITMEDSERTGLNRILDGTYTTGQFAIGIRFDRTCEELRSEISDAGLIISKGMANYESISDQEIAVPVAYILRTKCRPVARSIGTDTNINVVLVSGANECEVRI